MVLSLADGIEDLIEESEDTKEPNVSARAWLEDRIRRSCTKKVLFKRIPICSWAPKYNIILGISDLLAGITVGLTVIPQAIAYANIAGIPAEYGLYSSFVGCFVYTIFGSCKDSPVGPTAIAAILTRENIHDMGPQFAILLCFITGCVQLIMGVLQLGKLLTNTLAINKQHYQIFNLYN